MMRRTGKRMYMMLPVGALMLGSCAMLKKQPQQTAAEKPAQARQMEFIDGIAISRDPKTSDHAHKNRNTVLRESPAA